MPSAKAIKARNRKYYKGNAENIRSQSRDNYQNNPPNKKDASRACYNADPNKAKEAARKQNKLLSLLIQSPKTEPLISNIVIILRKKRLPYVYAWLSTVIIYVLKNELSMHYAPINDLPHSPPCGQRWG